MGVRRQSRRKTAGRKHTAAADGGAVAGGALPGPVPVFGVVKREPLGGLKPTDPPLPEGNEGLSPDILPPLQLYPRRKKPVLFIPVKGACRWAKVSGRDYGRVRALCWYTDAYGYPRAHNTKASGGDGRSVTMHGFILGRRPGFVIDHIDGDKRNCTRENLRHVRGPTNAGNRVASRNSTSGVRGVHSFQEGARRYWRIEFEVMGKSVRLGQCKELTKAKRVVAVALGLMYGAGVRLIDETPFDESQIEKIAAVAAEMPPSDLWMVLAKTVGMGDEMSQRLRARLVAPLVRPAKCPR